MKIDSDNQELINTENMKPHEEESTRDKIFNLVESLDERDLLMPFWQRGFQWHEPNKKDYTKYLIGLNLKGRNPCTTVVTCRIKEENYQNEYVLDGNQRLNTCSAALKNSEKYDVTKEQIKTIFKRLSVSLVHRNYDTHREAAEEYQRINKSTRLTDYDYHKIPITTLKFYDKIMDDVQEYFSFY